MLPSVFELRSVALVVLLLGAVGLLAALVAFAVAFRAWHARRVSRREPLALLEAPRAVDREPSSAGPEPPLAFDLGQSFSVGAARARHAAPTRHPIVLVHGYFGFDAIGVSRLRPEYFRGVRRVLEALGYEVHVVRVAKAAGVALRAEQLAGQIRRLPAPRVNVIAHSMGGLDARYAIARLGIADRVASLITVGTPHHGTPVADKSARVLGEWRRLRRALRVVGIDIDGLYDLTTERMAAFNVDVPDSPGVVYASIVGSVTLRPKSVHAVLAPAHAYLEKLAGPNDGLVPADSQRWGRVLGEVDADHWAQIGWSGGFDAARLYAALAGHLAELGH